LILAFDELESLAYFDYINYTRILITILGKNLSIAKEDESLLAESRYG